VRDQRKDIAPEGTQRIRPISDRADDKLLKDIAAMG